MLVALAAPAAAEPVAIELGDLRLSAELMLAPGKRVEDGVVLLTHGTFMHARSELMAALQAGLQEKAISSLAITLALGVDARDGMRDCARPHRHRQRDGEAEIAAWLSWLRRQGAGRITLAGHSRGGAQTAAYAARHDVADIAGVVLIAPAVWDAEKVASDYAAASGRSLDSVVEEARRLVAAGRGDTLMQATFLLCPDAPVSAATFLDYYTEPADKDAAVLLPHIAKPVLVLAASEDQIFPDLAKRIAPLADGVRVTLVTIDGADHFFQDLYADEAAERIAQFVGALP